MDSVRLYEGEYVPPDLGKGELALGPNPVDGGICEDTLTSLSWVAGDNAASHDVYLGDDFQNVSNGTGGTFLGNQRTTTLILGSLGSPYQDSLVPGATYYWRIDEVESDGTIHKGEVWSVSIRTFAPYTGPLTYAANHGNETSVGWWNDLDYIGIDAYYPLTNKNNPTEFSCAKVSFRKISTT